MDLAMCHIILNNSEGSLYHFDLPLKRYNSSIRRVRTYVYALIRLAEDMKKRRVLLFALRRSLIHASSRIDSRFGAKLRVVGFLNENGTK